MTEQEEDSLCLQALEENDFFQDGLNDLLAHALNRWERERNFQQQLLQSGGGISEPNVNGSLHFDPNPVETKTTVRLGVREHRFTTRLRQSGNFIEQSHLVMEIQQGLRRAIDALLRQEEIGSNRLSYNFGSWQLRGRDWRNNTPHVEQDLQRLANSLNSNESFEMNDSFNLTFVHFREPPHGSGHNKKYKPGNRHPAVFRKVKQSVVSIKNRDELCCARALVTARAYVDNNPKKNKFVEGGNIQDIEAYNLHRELQREWCSVGSLWFTEAPSLQDYRIIVVDANRSFAPSNLTPGRETCPQLTLFLL